MPIYVNNYQVSNIFDSMTLYDKKQHDGISRDSFLKQNQSVIQNLTGTQIPFHDMATYYNGQANAKAVASVGDSLDAWKTLANITGDSTGRYTVIGWDTETIGFANAKIPSMAQGSGITELGLSKTVYNAGRIESVDAFSIIGKLTKDQETYISEALNIFNTSNGDLSKLNQSQLVTLSRVSMYNRANVTTLQNALGDGIERTVVTNLSESNLSANAIQGGLNVLKKAGNTDISSVLPTYIDAILSGDAIVGANVTNFDLQVLRNAGVSENKLDELRRRTADITMGHTTIATSQHISQVDLNTLVNEGKPVLGLNGAGTVSGINASLGYEEFAAHNAGQDSYATTRIALTKRYLNPDVAYSDDITERLSFADNVLKAYEDIQHETSEVSSIFDDGISLYVHRGILDKNSIDFAAIKGGISKQGRDIVEGDVVITQNYSIAGQNWIADSTMSGFVVNDNGEESYLLHLTSASDPNVTVTKQFNASPEFNKTAEDSLMDFLANNTSIRELSQESVELDARNHILDYGRREYDRFFDVHSPASAGNKFKATNGFVSLEKYLDAFDSVQTALGSTGMQLDSTQQGFYSRNTLRMQIGDTTLQQILNDAGLDTEYSRESFLGMYGRLQDEHSTLSSARTAINNTIRSNNDSPRTNFLKTSILRDVKEQLDGIAGSRDVLVHKNTQKDFWSLDILVDKQSKQYRTIEGDSFESLRKGLYRALNDYDKNTQSNLVAMADSVRDLVDRGLLSKEEGNNLIEGMSHSNSTYYESYQIAHTIEDSYFGHFREMTSDEVLALTASDMDEEIAAKFGAKNKDGIAPSAYLESMTSDAAHSLDAKVNPDGIESIVQKSNDAFKNIEFTYGFNPTMDDLVTRDLQRKLRWTDDQAKTFTEMWTGSSHNQSYALSQSKVISTLVTPDVAGDSGFILLTNKSHSNNVIDTLKGLDDYKAKLAKEGKSLDYAAMQEFIGKHATIYELKALERTSVASIQEQYQELFGGDIAEMVSIKQGKNERYSHVGFNFYTNKDGVLQGGIKQAGDEVVGSFRQGAKTVYDLVEKDNFEEGSRVFKKIQDKPLMEEAGVSSYQGMTDATGRRLRYKNVNGSDLHHAFAFDARGLEQVQDTIINSIKDGASVETDDFLKLLYAFNDTKGIVNVSGKTNVLAMTGPGTNKKQNAIEAYQRITKSKAWEEFYNRHLLDAIHSVADNDVFMEDISDEAKRVMFHGRVDYDPTVFQDSIVGIMNRSVQGDTSNRVFSQQVQEALQKFVKVDGWDQIGSERAVKNGIIYITKTGAFSPEAAGIPTNRPVYIQHLNARMFRAKESLNKYLNTTGSVLDLRTTLLEKEWLMNDDLILPDGTAHKTQSSRITTTVKEMSDEQLQKRFLEVRKQLKQYTNLQYAQESGIANSKLLQEAFDFFVASSPTVYEGASILSPTLYTELNQMTVDTKRVTHQGLQDLFDDEMDSIAKAGSAEDRIFTEAYLQRLSGKKIHKGDVIGRNSRGYLTWNSVDTILTKENIDELISTGSTTIVPTNNIEARKYMINGSEKFVARGADIDKFVSHMAQQGTAISREEASNYLEFIWSKVADINKSGKGYTPTVIGNLEISKHASGTAIASKLNVIVDEYRKADKLDDLAKAINHITNGAWNASAEDLKGLGKTFITDTTDSRYFEDVSKIFYELLEVTDNNIGSNQINKRINKRLADMNENGLAFLSLQSNVQNQIMGEHLMMDPRIEAAFRRTYEDPNIRERLSRRLGRDIDTIPDFSSFRYEERMMDAIYDSVMSGADDYMHAEELLGGNHYGAFNRFVENRSKEYSAELIRRRIRATGQQDVVKAFHESLTFAGLGNTAKEQYIQSHNIVRLSIDDVLKQMPTASAENMSNSIFKNSHGEFSKWFRDVAAGQKVDLNADSLTVAIDMGREFNINKYMTKDILMPISTISKASNAEDVFFIKSQKQVMSLFRKFQDNASSSEIQKALNEMFNAFSQELSIGDKTSMIYKAFGKYEMPNSAYLEGQDEIAPVIKEAIGLNNEYERLVKLIDNSPRTMSDAELADAIDNALLERTQKLRNIANDIRQTGNVELSGNQIRKFINSKGQKIDYGNFTKSKSGGFLSVTAVNANTFEHRLGFDIGVFGQQLYMDLLGQSKGEAAQHYMNIGTRNFSWTKNDIFLIEQRVKKHLRESGASSRLDLDFEHGVMNALEEAAKEQGITIKELNESFIEQAKRSKKAGKSAARHIRNYNEAWNDVFDAFRFLGMDYLQEIGLSTRMSVRLPAFGIGMGPTNIILDDAVGDGAFRQLGTEMAHKMKLDHDGDIAAFAIHNASVAARVDNKEIEAAHELLEFDSLINLDIIATDIENGVMYKTDKIGDINYTQAKLMQVYDKPLYEEALANYASRVGMDVSSGWSEGQELLALHSEEMQSALNRFYNANPNMLQSHDAIVASLKAKTNKENIGWISSPSFKLHDAFAVAYEAAEGNDALREQISRLHGYMDYMGQDGMNGFLTIAEQKGIDTKHIIEATYITDTEKFRRGLNTLFETNTDRRNVSQGMDDVLTSLSHVMFGRGADNQAIIKDIIEGPDSLTRQKELYELLDAYETKNKGVLTKQVQKELNQLQSQIEDNTMRLQLRGLYEASEITQIRTAFRDNGLRNIFTAEEYGRVMRDIQEMQNIGLTLAGHSNMFAKTESVRQASSSTRTAIDPNSILYITRGVDLETAPQIHGGAYVVQPFGNTPFKKTNGGYEMVLQRVDLDYTNNTISNALREVPTTKQVTTYFHNGNQVPKSEYYSLQKDVDAKRLTAVTEWVPSTKKIEDKIVLHGNTIDEVKMQYQAIASNQATAIINKRSFIENIGPEMEHFIGSLQQKRSIAILNESFLGMEKRILDGNTRTASNTRKIVTALSSGDALKDLIGGGTNYENIMRLVRKTTDEELTVAQNFMEFANFRTNSKTEFGDLVRAMNQDIVSNPDKYARKTNFKTFTDIFEHHLGNALTLNDESMKLIKDEFVTLDKANFDFKQYDKILNGSDGLRNNLYDIMGEQKQLRNKLNELEKAAAFDDTVKAMFDDAEKIVREHGLKLTQVNQTIINGNQSKIYGLFNSSSYQSQMNAIFRWNNQASMHTMVGFGEYIGYEFQDLSREQVDKILSSAKLENGSAQYNYAYEKTISLLKAYDKAGQVRNTSAVKPYSKKSKALAEQLVKIDSVIEQATPEAQAVFNKIDNQFDDMIQDAAEQMTNRTVKQKSLHTEWFNTAKEFASTHAKGIAIGATALAALGILNNLTHRQKHQSPLAPARRDDSPNNYSMQPPAMQPIQQPDNGVRRVSAPSSNKTVYHDNKSGLTFKVSSKTQRSMDAQSYGKAISSAGGGTATVNIQNDNSKISDSWLQDKFAQMSY